MRLAVMTGLVAVIGFAGPALAQVDGFSSATIAPPVVVPAVVAPAVVARAEPARVAASRELSEAEQAGYTPLSDAATPPTPSALAAAPEAETNAVPGTLNAQYANLDQRYRRSARLAERPAAPAAKDSAPVAPELVAEAVAFQAYMQKSAAVDSKFTGAAGVKAALARGAAYKIQQLSGGAAAFAGLVALQDAAFVAGVEHLKAFPESRADVVRELIETPDAVLQIPGSSEAAGSARAAIVGLGRALVVDGRAVKKAAYTVQAEAWSKKAAEGQEGRLAAAKAVSKIDARVTGEETKGLMTSLVDYRTGGQSAPDTDGRVSPIVAKGLALAALMVLGEADEAHLQDLQPLLADAKNADCLNMAKLNLFQCLSVAGPEYEDVFCLGEHAMTDTGQCMVSAAGVAPVAMEQAAAAPALAQSAPAPAEPVDVQVPMAFSAAEPVAAPVLAANVPVALPGR